LNQKRLGNQEKKDVSESHSWMSGAKKKGKTMGGAAAY